MKKMTIFRYIRSKREYDKIIGRETLRVVNVHPSFIGIGKDEEVNRAEFRKLADILEPTNEGINIS